MGWARPPLFLDQTEARRAEKKFRGRPCPPAPLISRSGSGTAIKQNFMTFKDRLLSSMNFQARKMKCLNSITFQVFFDLYEPCNKRECQPSSLWVFFKYPKISKNGNLLIFPVNKASSTCIRIFLNPQLFLSGYGFRPHVSGESGK